MGRTNGSAFQVQREGKMNQRQLMMTVGVPAALLVGCETGTRSAETQQATPYFDSPASESPPYDVPARNIPFHAPSELPPSLTPPEQVRLQSASRVVTPQDRNRIERTRQLAKAFQESMRMQITDRFCNYVREHPAEDAWGVQFRVGCVEDRRALLLRSAGPDQVMDTRDDVTWPEWEYHDKDGF